MCISLTSLIHNTERKQSVQWHLLTACERAFPFCDLGDIGIRVRNRRVNRALSRVLRETRMPLVGGTGLLLAQGALCRSSYTHTPGSAEPAAGQREALADCYSTAIVRCIRIITHLPVSSASFVYGAIAPRGLLLALRGWFCCVCVSHAQHHIQSFATTNSSLLKTATFFLGFGKAGRGAYSDDPKPDLW